MASKEHIALSDFIKSIHQTLRDEAKILGTEKAWEIHCSKQGNLEKYASAMKELSCYHWESNYKNNSKAISRNTWVYEYCKFYFGIEIYRQRQKEQEIAEKIGINAKKISRLTIKNKIKLLDVGSCYNPFNEFDCFEVTPIDIAPANKMVYKCDFLNLEIKNSPPKIKNSTPENENSAPKNENSAPANENSAPKNENSASKIENSAPKIENLDPKNENSASKIENSAPKIENSVPKDEISDPKIENSVPKNEYSVPKNENSVPKNENSVPKNENSDPKIENSVPKDEISDPKIENSVPKNENSASKIENSGPKIENSVPKNENSVPKNENSASKIENSAPKIENSVPKDEISNPKIENSVPKNENSVPKNENSVPKNENSVPKIENSAPKIENSASKIENSAPKIENSVPKNENSAPENENFAPKNENSASKIENTAPKIENSAPKNENSAPKNEISDLKIENLAPEIENHEIRSLIESTYDVVVFSLLLEYLPSPNLRMTCCEQALKLLKTEGVLIIITPDSKHVGANAQIIKSWRYVLGNLGFSRIKYEKLPYLHCMTFRKCLDPKISQRWVELHKKEQVYEEMFIPQDFQEKVEKIEYSKSEKCNVEDFCELPQMIG